jgi:hypothetical protein
MLLTLTLSKLLDVWHELELCYYNQNGFGDDTAEIYAYRLTDFAPTAYLHGEKSVTRDEARREAGVEAARNLNFILSEFLKRRPDVEIEVDGFQFHKESLWLLDECIDHRCHVRITHKAPPKEV